jgi:hypothetical protein
MVLLNIGCRPELQTFDLYISRCSTLVVDQTFRCSTFTLVAFGFYIGHRSTLVVDQTLTGSTFTSVACGFHLSHCSTLVVDQTFGGLMDVSHLLFINLTNSFFLCHCHRLRLWQGLGHYQGLQLNRTSEN